MAEQVGGKFVGNACVCPKTQKGILNGAWFRVFVLKNGAAPNELQTLSFVKEHVAISDPELRELFIGHRHREHVINVDSAIKDVLGSEIGALRPGSIHSQCLTSDDFAFLADRA